MLAVLLAAQPARATARPTRLDIAAQDLALELSELARASSIELLFDRAIVPHRRGAALSGSLTPRQALARLLKGSGLDFRETAEGVFVIAQARPPAVRTTGPGKPQAPADVGAVAEILVIGRRSLNVDIPRSEDDIQPYEVATSRQIAESQAETVEDFLRRSLPDDTASPAAIQEPSTALASAASQVNLRGLGLEQTLLLLDGRRLPSTLIQPDLNGLPLEAIDRIETLTSTAGGIYGPDATGGVLNVVQKRDYQGGELSVTSGETTRGDAPEWRVDGAIGGSSAITGTKAILAFSHAEDAGLNFGARSFVQSAQALAVVRASGLPPIAGQVNVESSNGTPLSLIPSLGSQSLGSMITHLPLGVALAGSSDEATVLLKNAGAYDGSLSPDGRGAEQSLLTATQTNSILFNARQSIGARLEAFIDLVYLSDRGAAKVPALNPLGFLDSGQAGNPFQQSIELSFPTPGIAATLVGTTVTERATAGLIANLGRGWSGEADLTVGRAVTTERAADDYVQLSTTPFAGGPAFAAALAAFTPGYQTLRLSDQLSDLNLRLSGPLITLPGGPLTMTLLAETRYEHPPADRGQDIDSLFESSAQQYAQTQALMRQQVSSLYAEARAPLVADNPQAAFLRGLELQLAIRGDWSSLRAGQPSSYSFVFDEGGETDTNTSTSTVVTDRTATTSITAGAKMALAGGVVFRSSVATGYLPITPFPYLTSDTYSASPSQYLGLVDPRRGGEELGTEAAVTLIDREYPHPPPERALTASIGTVVTPAVMPGLRFSIDYTRTELSHGITDASIALEQYLLDHEASYPDRIVRAPLSSADAANGYTAGVVTSLDYSEISVARTTVDAVHMELSYARDTRMGTFRFSGQGTWEPDLRIRDDPTQPAYDVAGYTDGPLKWRGTLGLNWTRGRWTAALNGQVYGGYREAVANPEAASENAPALTLQGSSRIPAQAYVDALVAYRYRLRLSARAAYAIEYKLGIRNLFDRAPPLVVGPPLIFQRTGYSTYGDPRGSQFQFTVTAHF